MSTYIHRFAPFESKFSYNPRILYMTKLCKNSHKNTAWMAANTPRISSSSTEMRWEWDMLTNTCLLLLLLVASAALYSSAEPHFTPASLSPLCELLLLMRSDAPAASK